MLIGPCHAHWSLVTGPDWSLLSCPYTGPYWSMLIGPYWSSTFYFFLPLLTGPNIADHCLMVLTMLTDHW